MPLEDDKRTSTPDSDDQLFVHEEYFFHEPMRYYSAVKCALNAAFTPESLKTIRDFPVYEDDIWLPTFPKTGMYARTYLRTNTDNLEYIVMLRIQRMRVVLLNPFNLLPKYICSCAYKS